MEENNVRNNDGDNTQNKKTSLYEFQNKYSHINFNKTFIQIPGKTKFISLSEYINDYLLLQKMRYNRRLTYHIDIPEELLNCRIPKLLIQPVVENSLKYAGEQKKYIEIWICAFHRANGLVLSVKDNGDGIEEGKLEELRKRFDMDYSSGG